MLQVMDSLLCGLAVTVCVWRIHYWTKREKHARQAILRVLGK